jgi:hypothetical protein
MTKPTFDINKLRVAAPCSIPWETMTGDERVRRCDSCRMNIYNIAEMTRAEAENLIKKREGRLCIRLYKRADGTILTKDCPVGLRAYRKRIARLAGAALATVLGLFSASFGQKDEPITIDASQVKIGKTLNQNQESSLSGVIVDPNGAVIPGAEIKLYKEGEKKAKFKVKSDENGEYAFKSLAAGKYTMAVRFEGFKKIRIGILEIKSGENNQLNVTLEVETGTVVVGIYGEAPLIDMESTSVKTTISREMIDRLPN